MIDPKDEAAAFVIAIAASFLIVISFVVGLSIGREDAAAVTKIQPVIETPSGNHLACSLCGKTGDVATLSCTRKIDIDLCLNCVTCLQVKGDVECEASTAPTTPALVSR